MWTISSSSIINNYHTRWTIFSHVYEEYVYKTVHLSITQSDGTFKNSLFLALINYHLSDFVIGRVHFINSENDQNLHINIQQIQYEVAWYFLNSLIDEDDIPAIKNTNPHYLMTKNGGWQLNRGAVGFFCVLTWCPDAFVFPSVFHPSLISTLLSAHLWWTGWTGAPSSDLWGNQGKGSFEDEVNPDDKSALKRTHNVALAVTLACRSLNESTFLAIVTVLAWVEGR